MTTPNPSAPSAVVIGASVAGLFAAYLLARDGVRVRLFEEMADRRPDARTLIVTGRCAGVLGYNPSEAVINHTPHLRMFSPGGSALVTLRDPDLVVERETLMRLLADKARRAGVEVIEGRRFVGVEPEPDALTVTIEDSATGKPERLRTRILVGADGMNSRVARSVDRDTHERVSILQARVALPSGASSDTTETWFAPHATRYFYWLIPESARHAAVGLVADNKDQAKAGLDAFLADRGLTPIELQEAEVPLYSPRAPSRRRYPGGTVYMVGDAAGHVKVTTVGGVVTGLRGARAVAHSILQKGMCNREQQSLDLELRLHLLVRNALNRLSPGDYDEAIRLANLRASRALSAGTRDDIVRLLLPSLILEPRFLLLAAKSLLSRPIQGANRA